MGISACYCGLIYNDFMSLPWNIFGSCYENVIYSSKLYLSQQEDSLETVRKPECVYPIGLDPKWYIASNELMFFNSFKMKFAVIYGVI
jgi:V-type H+-transporting ATPase subunit a